MTPIRAIAPFALVSVLAVAACSPEPAPEPDTPPPGAPDASAPSPAPAPAPDPAPPPNAPSPDAPYVGVWAGPQASCDNAPATGERAPIQITRTGFLGYENRCDIRSITRQADGYDAVLSCESEGTASTERVRMTVNADTLDLTYVDRDATASFRRCQY